MKFPGQKQPPFLRLAKYMILKNGCAVYGGAKLDNKATPPSPCPSLLYPVQDISKVGLKPRRMNSTICAVLGGGNNIPPPTFAMSHRQP